MLTSSPINISIALLLISLFLSTLNANEIIGCGGFIKSNTDINYKIIQVCNLMLVFIFKDTLINTDLITIKGQIVYKR